jgi:sensor c-di-GMP phosphodiesterase-like protein
VSTARSPSDRLSASAKIVGSVIDLAKSLGMQAIAEGIEHVEELQEIIRRGGEYGQGFFFGKAIPAAEATLLAQEGRVWLKRA